MFRKRERTTMRNYGLGGRVAFSEITANYPSTRKYPNINSFPKGCENNGGKQEYPKR